MLAVMPVGCTRVSTEPLMLASLKPYNFLSKQLQVRFDITRIEHKRKCLVLRNRFWLFDISWIIPRKKSLETRRQIHDIEFAKNGCIKIITAKVK
jgi:hypothetical protein